MRAAVNHAGLGVRAMPPAGLGAAVVVVMPDDPFRAACSVAEPALFGKELPATGHCEDFHQVGDMVPGEEVMPTTGMVGCHLGSCK